MTERPTYLPMLEAIANAERQGHEYYSAWYQHATDPDLKETMRVVANRELEHSLAFRKRIDELGFECQPAEILDFSKQIEIVTSDCSDWEKVQALELTDLAEKVADPKNDPFGKLFKDLTIDIQTGALLGRYIAEERDSARLFRSCYEQLVAAGNGSANATSESLQSLDAKVDALCRAVDELRQIVVAQAMPAPTRKSRAAS